MPLLEIVHVMISVIVTQVQINENALTCAVQISISQYEGALRCLWKMQVKDE